MKHCPRCNRNYADDALSYCLEDGTLLEKKYDADATLINPYPPAAVVPPTVAYQPVPATANMRPPVPAGVVAAAVPPRRSPWLVGVLVFVALAVGLTIGALIFQRSSTSSEVPPPVEPDRNTLGANATTPTPGSSAPTPTPTARQATSPASTADQSTPVEEQQCVLYNDKSEKTVVNVRVDCDTRNCEMDASTIAGEYPDNTPIRVVRGSNVQTARYTWVKVVIAGTGRTVWVASSKIKCS